ncbi:MAG: hypothetical protein IJ598_07410 [Ruminococcus sp.]|nr:hypothetical protein [Ruminococcus sp.]
MAGKHSQKGSNGPLIVLIIVAVVVVAAIIAGAVFLMNGGLSLFQKQESTEPTTVMTTTVAVPETTQAAPPEATTVAAEQPKPEETTVAPETGVPAEEEPIDIVVPTDEGVDITYFNATFIPNGKVEDAETGGTATLREVFGSGYSDGVLTFNSDGTFRDTLVSGDANRGAYVVQDKTIHATYTNDKNMRIEVTEWDGGTPVSFHIDYNGYIVYFG